MSSKAFNLRGTNGSGKTFVARALIKETGAEPCEYSEKGKIRSYLGYLHSQEPDGHFKHPIVILGSYAAQCGGCDTIPSVGIVANMLRSYMLDPKMQRGLVFYEGLMISHMIGTVGNAARAFGYDHVMGFLTTPLDVCIARVRARREERGADGAGFDPKNIIADHPRVRSARQNAMNQGFTVVDVPYENAVGFTLGYIREQLSVDLGTRVLDH